MERISSIALWLTFAVFIHLQIVDVVLGQPRTLEIVSRSDLDAGITVSSTSNDSDKVKFTLFFRDWIGSHFGIFHHNSESGGAGGTWISLGFQNGVEEESRGSSTSTMTGPRGTDYLFINVKSKWIPVGATFRMTAKHRNLNQSVVSNVLPSLVTAETGSTAAWIREQRTFSYEVEDDALPKRRGAVFGRRIDVTLACTPGAQAAQTVNLTEPVTVLFAYGKLTLPSGIPMQHDPRHRMVVLRQNSTSQTLCPAVSDPTSTTMSTKRGTTATTAPSTATPSTVTPSTEAPSTEATSTEAPSTEAPSTATSSTGAPILPSSTHTQTSNPSSDGDDVAKSSSSRLLCSASLIVALKLGFISLW